VSLTVSSPRSSPAPEPGATQSACVFVVGMHRSGSSAATEVLASVGLHGPVPDDRFPTSPWNAHGNWESRGLTTFNDRLLRHLGGTWSAPPALDPRWEADSSLDEWRAKAGRLFAHAYPRRPSVWKDPRVCVLLPFWQQVVEPPQAALFVYRDPLEVAASLAERDGLTELHALALWERYTRAACANLHGVPTLLCDHRRILEEPAKWRGSVTRFLAGIGVPVEVPGPDAGPDAIDPRMRHQHSQGTPLSGPGRSAQELFERLGTLEGEHRHWRVPDLGAEPPWVVELLGLCREVEQTRGALRSAESSRAYRLASWLRGRRTAS